MNELPSRDPQESLEVASAVPDVMDDSDFLGVSDDGSRVTNETAEQIIELLDKLEKSGVVEGQMTGRKNDSTDFTIYCKTCTGQLQSI